jgi:NADPH-dependent ferric siderophore reductase
MPCEATEARALRRHLRTERGRDRDRRLVLGYCQTAREMRA